MNVGWANNRSILFYPTLVFARYDRNHEEAEEDVETQRAEREPLLGRQ